MRAFWGLSLVVVLILFQNCSEIRLDTSTVKNLSANATSVGSRADGSGGGGGAGGGNGEPYNGKPIVFHAYTPGFTCKDQQGVDQPHPSLIVEKRGDIFVKTEESCVSKNQIIPAEQITLSQDGLSLQFNSVTMGPAKKVEEYTDPLFFFVEAECTETLQSAILRKYGVYPLSEAEMQTSTIDVPRVTIKANYLNQRTAVLKVHKNLIAANYSNLDSAPTSLTVNVNVASLTFGANDYQYRGVNFFTLGIDYVYSSLMPVTGRLTITNLNPYTMTDSPVVCSKANILSPP